jgi:hypothetical protein
MKKGIFMAVGWSSMAEGGGRPHRRKKTAAPAGAAV